MDKRNGLNEASSNDNGLTRSTVELNCSELFNSLPLNLLMLPGCIEILHRGPKRIKTQCSGTLGSVWDKILMKNEHEKIQIKLITIT